MKSLRVLTVFAVLTAVTTLVMGAVPAAAVTSLTVNGLTSGTVTLPGPLVFRCNTSATGARVRFVIGADLNGNGRLDAGEPVFQALGAVQDGAWTDEDAAAASVQLTFNADGNTGGSLVVQAIDDGDGSTVGHLYSVNYTHPGQSISGTVLHDDGSPGQGLIVSTQVTGGAGTSYFTDAAGNYVLFLPAGLQPLSVFTDFAGPSFSPSISGVPLVDVVNLGSGAAVTGQNFILHIPHGPKIAGQITESDTSKPIPGVRIEATNISTGDVVDSYADIDGNYVLHVYAGTWNVQTRRERAEGPYGTASSQATVSTSDVTVNLSLPVVSNRIYGIVTGPGGVVLPNIRVLADNTVTHSEHKGECNGQGHYVVRVPPGSYEVHAEDNSSNPAYTFPASSVVSVTVPGDQRVDMAMVARPNTLSGQVTFQGTATGVPFAQISLVDLGSLYDDGFFATCDGQGSYSVKMPAGSFNATAFSSLYQASAGPTAVTFGGSQTLNFSLTPAHSAPNLTAGGVTPSTGGLVGQLFTFGVTYTSADNTRPGDVYVVIDAFPRRMAPVNPGNTNYAAGVGYAYQTTLPVGTHTFWFGALDQDLLGARLPANGTMSVTVAASGTLTGQVLLRGTTTTIPGAQVKAYIGSTLMGTATTDAHGVYQLSQALPAGTYVVSAGKDGFVTQIKSGISVTGGVTTFVNFGLVASGTLTGQVADKSTSAVLAGATVNAYLNGVLAASATTGANGVYVISRDLPTGSYAVVASNTNYVPQTKGPATVTAGQTTFVNCFLNKVCMTGQVRQAGTTIALVGATVSAYLGSATTPSATGVTDANGIYQLGGLTTGTYTVIASDTGYVKQVKPGISFTTGAVTYVNFNLQVSGRLMGQVWDKLTSAPVIGATVSARSGGVVRATGTTVGPYGIYQINSDLPAGTYTMLCTKSGYNDFGRLGIVVTAGATTYVNFPMQPQ